LAYLKFKSKAAFSMQKIIRLLQTNLFSRRPLEEIMRPINTGGPPDIQMEFSLVRD
jgi:hypothetical protein